MKIPTINMKHNGIRVLRNEDNTIYQVEEKEDLNKIFQTEWEFQPIDEEFTDKITQNQMFYDWIEDNFPLLHELEYELEIWMHGKDPMSRFNGNYFFVAEKFDGQKVLIAKYDFIGVFVIGGIVDKVTPEAALKYVEQVSA